MKIWKIIFYSFSAFPLLFILSLSAFYIHSASILGHFPSYRNPEPANIYVYNYYSPVILVGFISSMYSFALWLVLIIIHLLISKDKQVNTAKIISGAAYLLAYLLMFSRAFGWYLD
jgi:hypothetical protein